MEAVSASLRLNMHDGACANLVNWASNPKHDSADWHHDHGAFNRRHKIVGQGEADAA